MERMGGDDPPPRHAKLLCSVCAIMVRKREQVVITIGASKRPSGRITTDGRVRHRSRVRHR